VEDIRLVKKITDWISVEIGTRGRPKNRCRDEVINDLTKLELRKWIQLVKDREAWNDLVGKTKSHVGL
jgi:hypothetical protein